MRVDERCGQTVGARWRLESVLGSGATATVYSARRMTDGLAGALKLFKDEFSRHPRVLKLLLSEARVVAGVEHPGTVKLLDDGIADDGCAFIVFELLVGQTLDDLRDARGGRVPLDELMPIGNGVMDALSAVHDADIVHRDLTPANIFVLEGGGVKILDFGFAKRRGHTADAAQNVVGTPSFMPPEQALGLIKKVDARSDIWSLGAVLFHTLSGQSVHIAEHMNAMMLASASARPRSLAEAAPELPSKVVAVVDRALAYSKAERWPTMASMQAAWKDAHPHWLPALPLPTFHADPDYLDSSLLVPEASPTDSLFDPRELLNDLVEPTSE